MNRTIGGLAIALLMTTTLAAGASAAEAEDDARGPEIGAEAPDFTLSAVGDGEVTLSALRGQPVVMVFFRGAW
jgi:cytochrome oxidase Cu insertion factor (SCO1/SenC/PrrC family)